MNDIIDFFVGAVMDRVVLYPCREDRERYGAGYHVIIPSIDVIPSIDEHSNAFR